MRFAVHGPGIPEASLRSHGAPRRDIPGRVHISIAGEPAGRARGEDLTVESGLGNDVPARVLPRASRGSGHVPDLEVFDADNVESRAMAVVAFSAQSLRRSASRAFNLAMASRICSRRLDPRSARASLVPGGSSAWPPPGQARGVQQFPGGQRGRHRDAPVDANDLAVTRAHESGRGWRRTRHASGRPGPGSPGRTSRPAAPGATSGTAPSPTFGTQTWPEFRFSRSHVPGLAAMPGDPKPLMPGGLPPGRPGMGCPGRRRRHAPARSPAAPAAAPSGSPRPATGARPGPR